MIFSRRARAGAASGLSGLILMGLAAYGGFKAYKEWKSPYSLECQHNSCYVINELNGNKQPLFNKNGDMQLGDTRYRLDGILRESKQELKTSLDKIAREHNLK